MSPTAFHPAVLSHRPRAATDQTQGSEGYGGWEGKASKPPTRFSRPHDHHHHPPVPIQQDRHLHASKSTMPHSKATRFSFRFQNSSMPAHRVGTGVAAARAGMGDGEFYLRPPPSTSSSQGIRGSIAQNQAPPLLLPRALTPTPLPQNPRVRSPHAARPRSPACLPAIFASKDPVISYNLPSIPGHSPSSSGGADGEAGSTTRPPLEPEKNRSAEARLQKRRSAG